MLISICRKNLLPCNFLISAVARGMVLAAGFKFKHLLKSALTVTLKPSPVASFDCPGSNFGTMTKRLMHLGFAHGETTGVDFIKSLIIFDVAGLLDQPNALTEGSG